jgi:hypothetical protein
LGDTYSVGSFRKSYKTLPEFESCTKSRVAQNAYERGHRIGAARILKTESKGRYRKYEYKESAHVACLTNTISHHTSDISPIRIVLISKEAG